MSAQATVLVTAAPLNALVSAPATAVLVGILLASATALLLRSIDVGRWGGPPFGSSVRSARRPLTSPVRKGGWRRRRSASQRSGAVEAEALDLLDALAPALRAGLAPLAALQLVTETSTGTPRSPGMRGRRGDAPVGGELLAPTWSALAEAAARGAPLAPTWAALAEAAARGAPLAPTWAALAEAAGSDDLRLVAGAWSLCDRLGSPLAPTVATVSDVVRRRRAVRTRIATALAGPRATMWVLTALPLAGPLVALLVGVSPADLYAQPAGAASFVAGVALLVAGRWWAARMVRAVTSERTRRLSLIRWRGRGPARVTS